MSEARTATVFQLPKTRQVLKSWPRLYDGQWHCVALIEEQMRKQGFLAEGVSAAQWAKRLSASFEWRHDKVRYRNAQKPERLESSTVLAICPQLLDGQWHGIKPVVHALRQHGHLGKNGKVASRLNSEFELHPGYRPTLIRYLPARKT